MSQNIAVLVKNRLLSPMILVHGSCHTTRESEYAIINLSLLTQCILLIGALLTTLHVSSGDLYVYKNSPVLVSTRPTCIATKLPLIGITLYFSNASTAISDPR